METIPRKSLITHFQMKTAVKEEKNESYNFITLLENAKIASEMPREEWTELNSVHSHFFFFIQIPINAANVIWGRIAIVKWNSSCLFAIRNGVFAAF